MNRYRWVGGAEGGFYDTPYMFKYYGQLVDLPDDIVKRLEERKPDGSRILPLITEEEFDLIGHSPEELKAFAQFKSHGRAPQSFLDKRDKAWSLVSKLPE